MQILLVKASGKAKCRHTECEKKPEFISKNGRIIHETICACIILNSNYTAEYFCRDCIHKVYRDMKKILNPDLWVFG